MSDICRITFVKDWFGNVDPEDHLPDQDDPQDARAWDIWQSAWKDAALELGK